MFQKTSCKRLLCFLLFNFLITQLYAEPKLEEFEGFWIYGFEQSVFETCGGKRYWVWVDLSFEGKYEPEGYKNPVKIKGYNLPPNPDENMYSPLPELKVVGIEHIKASCKTF